MSIVTQYKFNNTIADLFPVFNDEFTYAYEDVVDGETTTRTINAEELPTEVSFYGLSGLLEVYKLDLSNVTSIGSLFYSCGDLTKVDLSNCNSSKLNNAHSIFDQCFNLESVNVTNLITNKITQLYSMFRSCKSLVEIIGLDTWDTSNVTNMQNMFRNCNSLTELDLNNWDTSKVTNMIYMFSDCGLLTSLNISNWNTGKVTNMRDMFYYCNKLTELDLSNWDMSNVTDMYFTFAYCHNLKTIGNVSNWNTSNITNMQSMFVNCSSLIELDVSNWNTGKVTTMSGMFNNCQKLTSLNLKNWDTSNVTTTVEMFKSCFGLTELDLSNWNTKNLESSEKMFNSGVNGTPMNLVSINLHNWDTNKNTSMYQMFRLCNKLKYLDISNFNLRSDCNISGIFEVYGIENIGMLYCNKDTVEKIVQKLYEASTIYVQNTKAYEYENTNYIKIRNYREQKVAINLPQPLRSVGNYKDRLYWDEEKGRYCIEQWIKETHGINTMINVNVYGAVDTVKAADYSSYFDEDIARDTSYVFRKTQVYTNLEGIKVWIGPTDVIVEADRSLFDLDDTATRSEFSAKLAQLMNVEGVIYVFPIVKPKIIETDITEKINFDTYNDYMQITTDDSELLPNNISAEIAMKETAINEIVYYASNGNLPSDVGISVANSAATEQISNGKLVIDATQSNYMKYYFENQSLFTELEVSLIFNSLSTISSYPYPTGFRMQLSDGTKGVQIFVCNNKDTNKITLYAVYNKTFNIIQTLDLGIEYNLKIRYENSSNGEIYINDDLVYTYNESSLATSATYCTSNAIFVQNGDTNVSISSIIYRYK